MTQKEHSNTAMRKEFHEQMEEDVCHEELGVIVR